MTEKEILLTSILQCSRSVLYTQRPSLDSLQLEKFNEALALRAQGVPLQYILGEVEFYGLTFKTDKRALIPRPETEVLVEAAMKKIENRGLKTETILDIGTGSGCIAVSIAKFSPMVKVTAVDISFEALSLAKENAILHSVNDRINFIQCDLLSALPAEGGSLPDRQASACGGSFQFLAFDFIISNPPYIRSHEIRGLQPELGHEPRIALEGGKDGLVFYRRIIKDAHTLLKKGGLLLIEIGFAQRKAIEKISARQNSLKLVEVINDYSGIERIMVFRYG